MEMEKGPDVSLSGNLCLSRCGADIASIRAHEAAKWLKRLHVMRMSEYTGSGLGGKKSTSADVVHHVNATWCTC